jgi:hypothetical protein
MKTWIIIILLLIATPAMAYESPPSQRLIMIIEELVMFIDTMTILPTEASICMDQGDVCCTYIPADHAVNCQWSYVDPEDLTDLNDTE